MRWKWHLTKDLPVYCWLRDCWSDVTQPEEEEGEEEEEEKQEEEEEEEEKEENYDYTTSDVASMLELHLFLRELSCNMCN